MVLILQFFWSTQKALTRGNSQSPVSDVRFELPNERLTKIRAHMGLRRPEIGGNPNVVIHDPDVKSFQINKENDFIVLG